MLATQYKKSNLVLRPVAQSDFSWLIELRVKTMTEYLEGAGLSVSHDSLKARVLEGYECIEIISLDGVDIGMIKVNRKQDFWHLIQIQILPEYQGRGIGAHLIKGLAEEAEKALVFLSLSVLKVNPVKRLYKKFGFSVYAETEHSYEMHIDYRKAS